MICLIRQSIGAGPRVLVAGGGQNDGGSWHQLCRIAAALLLLYCCCSAAVVVVVVVVGLQRIRPRYRRSSRGWQAAQHQPVPVVALAAVQSSAVECSECSECSSAATWKQIARASRRSCWLGLGWAWDVGSGTVESGTDANWDRGVAAGVASQSFFGLAGTLLDYAYCYLVGLFLAPGIRSEQPQLRWH